MEQKRLTPQKRNLRVILSIALCKFSRRILRFLGHGGTNLPGKIALRICPKILSVVATGIRIIVVSGTNGKTTTCHLIEQSLRNAGIECFANRSGANLLAGIVGEFIENAKWDGTPITNVAVIECDEATLKIIMKMISPEIIVLTNIFRDQLDRYGEVTQTLENLRVAIEEVPDAYLCLNADDSLVASLQQTLPNPYIFYGINSAPERIKGDSPSDAMYCFRCKHRYDYHYKIYGHLGGFLCPRCGYKRPMPQIAVDSIIESSSYKSVVKLSIHGHNTIQTVPLAAIYNIYNYLAAISAVDVFGIEVKELQPVENFGRMEHFAIGKGITLVLVKNPAGFAQVIEYLSTMTDAYDFVCCLNDQEADGVDISWIWDVPFEELTKDKKLHTVFVAGTRKEDLYLRLKHAGYDESALHFITDMKRFLRRVDKHPLPLIIAPTYTAMMQIRKQLAKSCKEKNFWE